MGRNTNRTSDGNPDLPETLPERSNAAWNIQAITQLTAAVAKMEQSVSHLSEKIGDLREDQRDISNRIASVERKLLVAAAIVSVVITIGAAAASFGGYVANKAIDFGLEMAKERINTPDAPPPPKAKAK